MGNLLWIIFGFLLVVAVVCNVVYFMRRKKKPEIKPETRPRVGRYGRSPSAKISDHFDN